MLLSEKVVLVTGAATGIGEAIARLSAEHGARVFLLDRDAAGNQAVAQSIRAAGGWAEPFAADVRQSVQIAPVVESAMSQFGRIDVLVNNAGIFPRQSFLEMTEAQWDEIQEVNLKGMFRTLKLVLPHMFAARAGKVVNLASITFFLGMAGLSHYVASKGGVIGLTRSLAREAGAYNVHVNCIAPGGIATASEPRFVNEAEARDFVVHQCLQRRITPLDVARACVFLASELSDGVAGQCLTVDGGWVMG